MKRSYGWIGIIVLVLLALLILPLLLRFGWGRMGFYGGMMGGNHMMPWGSSFGVWGWLAMIPMLLIPIGLLILTIAGGVWLGNTLSSREDNNLTNNKAQTITCDECGEPAAADWNTCPYCGGSLN